MPDSASAMADNIFSMLTGHASFDRSRFDGDISMFTKKRRAETQPSSTLAAFVSANGSTKSPETQPAKPVKRRKKKPVQPAEGTDLVPIEPAPVATCAAKRTWLQRCAFSLQMSASSILEGLWPRRRQTKK